MIKVVCWTLALLATARARVYERCELARDLSSLGMQDHLSTWVCIAYHESRFMTHAFGSTGDHGIFQISELYWCGGGKACGVTCEALRDDHIDDDVRCALEVHREHTRLQGNGFMAWVVYPLYCSGNTNHWLDDCNVRYIYGRNMKNGSSTTNEILYGSDVFKTPKVVNAQLSFLTVSSIFQDNYENVIKHGKELNLDWYNYKYDNIDELKPPGFERKENKVPQHGSRREGKVAFSPMRTPPVTRKYTETNQFRKKTTTHATQPTTEKSTKASNPQTIKTTTRKSEAVTPRVTLKVKSTTTYIYKSTTPTAAIKPVNITNTAYKLPAITTSYTRTTSPAPALQFTTESTTTTGKPQNSINWASTYPQVHATASPTTKRPAPYAETTQKTSRATQSIWDLYLNPTQAPKFEPFRFSNNKSMFKINIFSSGTTTSDPTRFHK